MFDIVQGSSNEASAHKPSNAFEMQLSELGFRPTRPLP